jgi:hypothetical protein
MRIARASALLLALLTAAPVVHGQSFDPSAGQLKVDSIIDRMNQAERGVFVRMRMYHPLMEVYIQDLSLDAQLGWTPTDDTYFLGQFAFEEAPALRPLSAARTGGGGLVARLTGRSGGAYPADSFAAMAAPDWHLLERSRYAFKYVRREFLGEARCFVFDVKPLRDERDGFLGRIWIDDRDYNLIRFNGINRRTDQALSSLFRRKSSFHMDGWRTNVMPGVWLPSYVYSEETDLNSGASSTSTVRFKSQTRIWGYQAQSAERTEALTTISIDEPNVADASASAPQLSPVLSQRRWEQEAEANVIERLERVGLLSPPGDADRVLETVLNNLVVTNDVTLERPLRCRILLTSPLESFTVGHTIVLSRGLIDVLPDEPSLAAMLAHELSHVVLGHPLIDTKFSFADRLMIADGDLLQTLRFRHTAREETAADEKVVELLEHSPYKGKMANAGIFLREISQRAKQLPQLIQPHIGDNISAGGQTLRLADLMQQAPALAPQSLDQIPALQLGARLVVDPWSGRLELDRSPAVPLASIREKVPLAVTPLMPRVKYAVPNN